MRSRVEIFLLAQLGVIVVTAGQALELQSRITMGIANLTKLSTLTVLTRVQTVAAEGVDHYRCGQEDGQTQNDLAIHLA